MDELTSLLQIDDKDDPRLQRSIYYLDLIKQHKNEVRERYGTLQDRTLGAVLLRSLISIAFMFDDTVKDQKSTSGMDTQQHQPINTITDQKSTSGTDTQAHQPINTITDQKSTSGTDTQEKKSEMSKNDHFTSVLENLMIDEQTPHHGSNANVSQHTSVHEDDRMRVSSPENMSLTFSLPDLPVEVETPLRPCSPIMHEEDKQTHLQPVVHELLPQTEAEDRHPSSMYKMVIRKRDAAQDVEPRTRGFFDPAPPRFMYSS